MSLPVVYRRRVQSDLAAAFDWYEEQSPGLGENLLSSVRSIFESIEDFPEMFAFVHGSVRRAIVVAVEQRLWRHRRSQKRTPSQRRAPIRQLAAV